MCKLEMASDPWAEACRAVLFEHVCLFLMILLHLEGSKMLTVWCLSTCSQREIRGGFLTDVFSTYLTREVRPTRSAACTRNKICNVR